MKQNEWHRDQVMAEINGELNGDLAEIAQRVYQDAKSTSAFRDKTGRLRASIKWHKSKFPDGGYIVIADAPHARLIEYGHAGPHAAGPRPFLRPALDRHIGTAKGILKASK